MSNHGLRRIFSLLLAVMMVCTLLPTAVFAEDNAQQSPAAEQPVAPSGDENAPSGDKNTPPPLVDDKTKGKEAEGNGTEDLKNDVFSPDLLDLSGVEDVISTNESNTGHTVAVNFAVLYIDDSYNLGYTYTTYERNTQLT